MEAEARSQRNQKRRRGGNKAGTIAARKEAVNEAETVTELEAK